MPNNWTKHILGDLIDVKHGYAFKGEFFSETPTKDILLSPGNFHIGGGFKADKFKYYSGIIPNDYILKENDLLITMTDLSPKGDTLGTTALIPKHNGINYLHNQRLGLVILKSHELSSNYLYWALRDHNYHNFIVSSATGSTVKHTSPSRIKEYEINLPPLPEQQAISEILSSLDDKIELNLQTNKTLEEMANALYKHWFVDFGPFKNGKFIKSELGMIPEGWKIETIGNVANIIDCLHSKKPELISENNGNLFLQLENILDNGLLDLTKKSFISDEDYKKWTSRIEVRFGDCVITNVGRSGAVSRIPKNARGAMGRNMTAIRLKENFPYPGFLITMLCSPSMKKTISKFLDTGTILEALNVKNIPKLYFFLPIDLSTLEKLEVTFKDFRNKMEENIAENSKLMQIRNYLLPKLISGEIQVKKAIKKVKEVL